ncbi:MAG: P-II family nitrogen regulator [Candidatus Omnitrophica bacterium]|nr:P-II family nitrogen regulator [Candidatus Omnitrophota bacterium]
MKKIECIIRPEKLKPLTDELFLAGIGGLTVTEAKGFGREAVRPENFLFLPKTKIEIYVTDEQLSEVIETISACCRDDKFGSGKIAILPIDDCIRVRTGEKGDSAIL